MKRLWEGGGQRHRMLWIVAGIASATLLAVVIATTRGGHPQGLIVDTAKLLAQARTESPFELKYPGTVPTGLSLNNVMWSGADPVEHPGSTDFSVDYWFVDADGARLHVWQTNLKDLGDWDPTQALGGSPEIIAGDTWIYERLSVGKDYTSFQLSRRFPDGVTVTIDYPVDGPMLRNVAAALTETSK
jgi:hypothetical protein